MPWRSGLHGRTGASKPLQPGAVHSHGKQAPAAVHGSPAGVSWRSAGVRWLSAVARFPSVAGRCTAVARVRPAAAAPPPPPPPPPIGPNPSASAAAGCGKLPASRAVRQPVPAGLSAALAGTPSVGLCGPVAACLPSAGLGWPHLLPLTQGATQLRTVVRAAGDCRANAESRANAEG